MRGTTTILCGHRNPFSYIEIGIDEKIEIIVKKKTGRFLGSQVFLGARTLYLEEKYGSIESQNDRDVGSQGVYST